MARITIAVQKTSVHAPINTSRTDMLGVVRISNKLGITM